VSMKAETLCTIPTGGGRRRVVANERLWRCGAVRCGYQLQRSKGQPGSGQGGAPQSRNKWTNGSPMAANRQRVPQRLCSREMGKS
jgi:hypothetical protein